MKFKTKHTQTHAHRRTHAYDRREEEADVCLKTKQTSSYKTLKHTYTPTHAHTHTHTHTHTHRINRRRHDSENETNECF